MSDTTDCRSTVYLLRHGDIRQDDIRRYIGQADIELNANGRAQALSWRSELSTIPLKRVYCSDLCRSHETACIIAEGRSIPVQSLTKLREINLGAWDGLAMNDVRCHYAGEYEKRGSDMVYYRPPAGECFADVAARVIPLFEEIVRNLSGNLLIVGHAGVNRVILSHLLGMPLDNIFRLPQDYGCLNVIDCDRERTRLREINLDYQGARRVILKQDEGQDCSRDSLEHEGEFIPPQQICVGVRQDAVSSRTFRQP
jgi:probable phosphoglycerate mutase